MYSKSAPHPFGNSVGEEIFQSGFIPSDTDFRVFRDFGNIPGLDLAHPMNGYRYHTKYDNIDYISKPCLQRTGDNVLGLVRNIANSEQLSDIKAHAKGINIYYDFLGLVFVTYGQNVAIILNVLVGFFSVVLPYLSLKRTTNGKLFCAVICILHPKIWLSKFTHPPSHPHQSHSQANVYWIFQQHPGRRIVRGSMLWNSVWIGPFG